MTQSTREYSIAAWERKRQVALDQLTIMARLLGHSCLFQHFATIVELTIDENLLRISQCAASKRRPDTYCAECRPLRRQLAAYALCADRLKSLKSKIVE